MMAPADPLTHLRTLLDEGRFREAVAWRRGAEPMLSGRPEGRLMVATAALRAGEVDLSRMDATAALEEFVAQADQDGRMRCHNLLGAIAFEQGKVAEARTAFATGLSLASDVGAGVDVGEAVGVGGIEVVVGGGVGFPFLIVRAKKLKLSTSAVAVKPEKSTAVAKSVHAPEKWC